MKRTIATMLTIVVTAVTLVTITAAPTQAAAILNCRQLTWLNDQDPPPYASWVEAIRGFRHGHFWTASNCEGTLLYWGRGQAFESATACTDVRVVFYDRNHNYDRATPWMVDCPGRLPVGFSVGRGREISFDTRHHSAQSRSIHSHSLFDLVTF